MGARKLERSVSIIGAGYSHMGLVSSTPELQDFSERELFASACIEAMEDAGIEANSIDALVLGYCAPNFFGRATSCAPHYMDWIGMHNKPAWFHDEGCATSVYGLTQAVMMVASGVYDCVITSGVGINTTVPLAARPPYLRETMDNDMFWEGMYYSVEPAYDKPGNAGVAAAEATALRYFKKYGYSYADFDDAMVTYLIGQRDNALNNPKSHMNTSPLRKRPKRWASTMSMSTCTTRYSIRRWARFFVADIWDSLAMGRRPSSSAPPTSPPSSQISSL